jgi:hypothetical protein
LISPCSSAFLLWKQWYSVPNQDPTASNFTAKLRACTNFQMALREFSPDPCPVATVAFHTIRFFQSAACINHISFYTTEN